MTDIAWSRHGEEDCIRLRSLSPATHVAVRPRAPVELDGLPPMAGRLVPDEGDVCFVPRFGFVEGTTYDVFIERHMAAGLLRPRGPSPATTEVVSVHPSSSAVPRNLLRLYVRFSAAMSEGYAGRHIRLVDGADREMVGALLPADYELWDAGRRRLTVLLDPARIKRGLVPHRRAGYPLRVGAAFRLVVDAGLRDARGVPLRAGTERRYEVVADERRRVDPGAWTVTEPAVGTTEPLRVRFDRTMDHGLTARCLRVTGPDGQPVEGRSTVGAEERSWSLTPREKWAPGSHHLVVDPVLEDPAGNSVNRVFDRDLTRSEDATVGRTTGPDGPVTVAFRAR